MSIPQKELDEKDFIREPSPKSPFPMWLWFAILTALLALLWGGSSWFSSIWQQKIAESPFLQVTNRQFSVFLWQFPEYMRVNSKAKSSYLPGFQYEDKVSVYPALADQFIAAPPDLIFLYHVWHRLVGEEYSPRKISPDEFKEFLEYAEEWQPKYWHDAPKSYVELLKNLSGDAKKTDDLDVLPTLPLQVKQAFQGWKNYFKEGLEINKLRPTYEQVESFLELHPHYARNYWRNILYESTPGYLSSFYKRSADSKSEVPSEQIAPFLRVALFNFLKSKREASL